ncbi:MAG TPA: hypothetical protein DCZ91_03590 [Lachnospiraceae bacterium]|nr:hypothetical protein [Lachnospiraceae bacterium]
MEILIYLVVPCVGSAFLLGSMFYAAYRMSGSQSMPREKDRPVKKSMPREEDRPERKSTSGQDDRIHRDGISGRTLRIITAYILVCVAFSLLGNTWVNLVFLILFPLTARWAFETPKAYCLYYFILSAAVWLTDVAGVLGLQIAMAEGLLYLNSPELQYILMVVVTRMAEFMVILLVALAAGHKTGRHITVRQVVISVLFPLYSIFNMYCLLYLMQIYPTRGTVLLFGVNLLLMIGLNLYFCVLVDVMSENYRLENERNLYRAQARMQHQYYEQEEEKYEASRKMIHDIRNHIQAMEALYARGACLEGASEGAQRGAWEDAREGIQRNAWEDAREGVHCDIQKDVRQSARSDVREHTRAGTRKDACEDGRSEVQSDVRKYIREDAGKDIQRAEKYAGDIHRMLNSLQQKYYTSEKLLNIILNDKARTMQRLGIREDMKVGELSLDFMKETDVTALFANLLDNAVAAAAQSKDGYVRLRVNRVRQFLSVTVENSCDAEPVKAVGTFRSRQSGREGLGLKIIRQTVEQYGGDVQMDWKEGVFTVRVMLVTEEAG